MASWAKLVMACPACIAKGLSPGPATSWYHSNCGGVLKVSDYADLKCDSCGIEDHFSRWRWGCPRHGDSTKESYYQETNASSVAAQISVSAAMSGRMGRRWLMRFLDYLGDW